MRRRVAGIFSPVPYGSPAAKRNRSLAEADSASALLFGLSVPLPPVRPVPAGYADCADPSYVKSAP